MGAPSIPPGSAGEGAGSDLEREAQTALVRGDRNRALTLLMGAYGRPVYRYCRAMLRQPEMTEDAHQTVFFQAYQDFHRFRNESSFKPWLFGIAHHRCLDALKANRRRTTRFASLEDEPERIGPGDVQEAHVAGREITDALRRCLDGVSEPVREALLLRYQAGMSYVEMASVCGDPAPTLQARVTRSLPSLRRCLERQGVRP